MSCLSRRGPAPPHRTAQDRHVGGPGAFEPAARNELLAGGIHYAKPPVARRGRRVLDRPATGRGPRGVKGTARAFLSEIRDAGEPRIVVSSEHFTRAQPAGIRRIVADLDPSAVRIAITLRPLARILSSQWQQFVQGGLRTEFEPWLRSVLVANSGEDADAFWLRHRHDDLIARWAEAVGPERVVVIVVDDRDHGFVLRAFEELLGARPGSLVSVPSIENRSLTVPEAEAIRQLKVALDQARLPTRLDELVVLRSAARQMKLESPSPDWPRIEAPQWALDRAGEISREMVAGIVASGVRNRRRVERSQRCRRAGPMAPSRRRWASRPRWPPRWRSASSRPVATAAGGTARRMPSVERANIRDRPGRGRIREAPKRSFAGSAG